MAEAVILLKDLFPEEEEPAVDAELDKGRIGTGSFSVIFLPAEEETRQCGVYKKELENEENQQMQRLSQWIAEKMEKKCVISKKVVLFSLTIHRLSARINLA